MNVKLIFDFNYSQNQRTLHSGIDTVHSVLTKQRGTILKALSMDSTDIHTMLKLDKRENFFSSLHNMLYTML